MADVNIIQAGLDSIGAHSAARTRPASRPTSRGRNWCFTLFDTGITSTSTSQLEALISAIPHLRYAVFQQEICPETSRLHHQGYIEFTRAYRFGAIQALFPTGCHIEPRRGPRAAAREYCMKELTQHSHPVEIGTWGTFPHIIISPLVALPPNMLFRNIYEGGILVRYSFLCNI